MDKITRDKNTNKQHMNNNSQEQDKNNKAKQHQDLKKTKGQTTTAEKTHKTQQKSNE